MFSSRSFAARLERVDGSVPSISAMSRYITLQLSHASKFVLPLEQAISRADAAKRLVLLYLMNDVLQANKAKSENLFIEAFERPLKRGFALIGKAKGEQNGLEYYGKAERLIEIWRTRDTLSTLQLDILRRALTHANEILDSMDTISTDFDIGGLSAMGFTPMTPMMQDTDEHGNNDATKPSSSITSSSSSSSVVVAPVGEKITSTAPPRSNSPLSLIEAEAEALVGILGGPVSLQTQADSNVHTTPSEIALSKAKTFLSAVEAAEVSVGLSAMDVTGLTARLTRVIAVEKTSATIMNSSISFNASSALETATRHLKALRAEKRAREEAVTALSTLLEAEASLVEEDDVAVNKALEQLHAARTRRETVRKLRDEAVSLAEAAEAATREAKLQAAARAAAEAKKQEEEANEIGKEEDGELQGIDIVKDVTSLLSLASRSAVSTTPLSSTGQTQGSASTQSTSLPPSTFSSTMSSSLNASRLLSSIMSGKKANDNKNNYVSSSSSSSSNSSTSLLGAPGHFQPMPLIYNNLPTQSLGQQQQQHVTQHSSQLYSSFPLHTQNMQAMPQSTQNVLLPYQNSNIGALQWNQQVPIQLQQQQPYQHHQAQVILPLSSKPLALAPSSGRGLGATVPAWMR